MAAFRTLVDALKPRQRGQAGAPTMAGRLSPAGRRVLLTLVSLSDNGVVSHGTSEVARRAQHGLRSVERALAELRRVGFIERSKRGQRQNAWLYLAPETERAIAHAGLPLPPRTVSSESAVEASDAPQFAGDDADFNSESQTTDRLAAAIAVAYRVVGNKIESQPARLAESLFELVEGEEERVAMLCDADGELRVPATGDEKMDASLQAFFARRAAHARSRAKLRALVDKLSAPSRNLYE